MAMPAANAATPPTPTATRYDNVVKAGDASSGAALLIVRFKDGSNATCSGNRIGPDKVLTAGHCFGNRSATISSIQVEFGARNKTKQPSATDLKKGVGASARTWLYRCPSTAVWTNYDEKKKNWKDDIAVVKLAPKCQDSKKKAVSLTTVQKKIYSYAVATWGYSKQSTYASIVYPGSYAVGTAFQYKGKKPTSEKHAGVDFAVWGGQKFAPGISGGGIVANKGGGWIIEGVNSAIPDGSEKKATKDRRLYISKIDSAKIKIIGDLLNRKYSAQSKLYREVTKKTL